MVETVRERHMVEMSDDVVVAEGLRKRFKHTEALRGLDLTVAAGTVCGLLGPNGAGKPRIGI